MVRLAERGQSPACLNPARHCERSVAIQGVMPFWIASPCSLRNDGHAMRLAITILPSLRAKRSNPGRVMPPLDCFTLLTSQ
ncbi:MAG: hypothetical protein LBT00_05460 [Spirochaetaceae bacterium]|nr:hypothetical protein [Spirochaetaceae bacterium]